RNNVGACYPVAAWRKALRGPTAANIPGAVSSDRRHCRSTRGPGRRGLPESGLPHPASRERSAMRGVGSLHVRLPCLLVHHAVAGAFTHIDLVNHRSSTLELELPVAVMGFAVADGQAAGDTDERPGLVFSQA